MCGPLGLKQEHASEEIFPVQPLDFEAVFGRRAPVEIDLGCGDGSYLAQICAAAPERNFVGIERLVGRVRSACFKVRQLPQPNVRLIRIDTRLALRELILPGTVDAFHIMFPDPWPKRRHHSRRLINREFLELLHRALVAGGTVKIATDDEDYFRAISAAIAEVPTLFAREQEDRSLGAVSTFEKRYRDEGLPIHRLRLRKVTPGT